MLECINDYYVYNGDIKDSKYINEEFLKNGISIYEVIRVINGVPLFFEDHMERLSNSLKLSKLSYKINIDNFYTNMKKLIDTNKVKNGNIKIVLNFSNDNLSLVNEYIYFINHHYPSDEEYKNGVRTILYKGERDNPNAKVINSSFREKANKKIQEAGAYEAILVDSEGNITEGSKSNIFCVKNNNVYTAPLVDVLPGVTRKKIIEVCENMKIHVEQIPISEKIIESMDGLFISGTSPQVLPIYKVDNTYFNSAKNNIIQNISRGYEEFMENYISENTF